MMTGTRHARTAISRASDHFANFLDSANVPFAKRSVGSF